MGTFTTREKSDGGNAWNELVSTNSIGGGIKIRLGSHQLTLSVRSTDRYELELDKTMLQLTCEGSSTGGTDDCSMQDETRIQNSTTTTEGTTTMTVVLVTVLATVVIVVIVVIAIARRATKTPYNPL